MNCNDEPGQRYFVCHLRRRNQCNALSFHLLLHHISVVEAEHAVLIVNEHVEVLQKIPARNSTNQMKIGILGNF